MEPVSLSFIARAVGGKVLGDAGAVVDGMVVDSRGVLGGKLFVALGGARADGHDFIGSAFANGAVAALVQRADDISPPPTGKAVILVSSTAQAMKELAKAYTATLPVRIVGITGSAGKTTTKDMVAAVLSQKYKTLKTEGNFNNEIGLPLTVARLEASHEYAVLEMGMNNLGEIDRLSQVAPPHIALITNIGMAHIENLGSRQGIFQAKTEIFNNLHQGGIAVLNRDDDMLAPLATAGRFANIASFGLGEAGASLPGSLCDVWADEVEPEGLLATRMLVRFRGPGGGINSFGLRVPVPGLHMLRNALAAVAVGCVAGLAPEQIRQGIEGFTLTKMRMEIFEGKGMTIINDAYNASPDSMMAALDTLKMAGGRKVALLGQMMELGDFSNMLHLEVVRRAVERADVAVFVGEAFRKAYEEVGRGLFFPSQDAMLEELSGILMRGDTVLVKAARSMGFERVVEALR